MTQDQALEEQSHEAVARRLSVGHEFADLNQVIMLGALTMGQRARELRAEAEERGIDHGPLTVRWTMEISVVGFERPEGLPEDEVPAWRSAVDRAVAQGLMVVRYLTRSGRRPGD